MNWSSVRVDVTPLRTSRDFRLLWCAGLIFYFGGMVSYVAIPFQIYRMTGSNFMIGLVGLVEIAPLVIFGLYGGAVADHFDRRKVLVGTGIANVVFTAALAWNASRETPSLVVIFVLAALLACASAMQRPSREALTPRTVTHDELPAATALSSLAMQLGVLAGPMVGGLLLASTSIFWCFALDAIGLTVATALYFALRPYPLLGEGTPPSMGGIAEGLRYAMSRRDLLGTYFVDIAAMLLAQPVVLFAAVAEEVFANPQLLGPLYTAETLGALLATATSGWIARVHRHGRAVVLAAMTFGGFIALAGLMPTWWLMVVMLAGAGAADMVSAFFRGTIWSQTIPDHMRGRLAGIELLSYSIGPMAGQARAGFVADRWSVRGSITSGGIACIVGVAATTLWLREFWSYDARTDEHAVAERAARAAHASGDDHSK